MAIIVRLDVVLAQRKRRAKTVAAEIGITEANLSLLRNGKVRGIRFETLDKLCEALDCQPGDLLEFQRDPSDEEPESEDDTTGS
ncbi:MAG: helix-turn-helix transcriptional regulator [Pseudomonadota bacterium]